MKFLTFLFFSFLSFQAWGQWTEINVNTSDDLIGVSFYGNRILAVSENNLHFSSNSGTTWNNVSLTNAAENTYFQDVNFIDSSQNERTTSATGLVYVIGNHIPTQTAVIYEFNLSNPSLGQRVYTGSLNSKLNDISNINNDSHVAVGDDGLILIIGSSSNLIELIDINIQDDLMYVDFKNQSYKVMSSNSLLYNILGGNTESFRYRFPDLITESNVTVFGNLGSSNTYFAGNEFFYQAVNNQVYAYGNYYGPIMATDIIERGSRFYVASDNGIYKNNTSDRKSLERQISSINYSVNRIVQGTNESGNMYAACDNGKLLFSSNDGGSDFELYTEIINADGCSGIDNNIRLKRGSATRGDWYVNGNLSSTDSYNTVIQNAISGIYAIEFRGLDGQGNAYVLNKNITISDEPLSVPITLVNQNVCANDGALFNIQNSELDIIYEVIRQVDNEIVGSVLGNGSNLDLRTNRITYSGDYYIRAKNLTSSCSVNLSAIYSISVDNIISSFKSGKANAYFNEQVTIYENGNETDNYFYTFPNGSSQTSSSLPDPTVSFSTIGIPSINLVSTNNNGCSDTFTGNGPNVLAEPVGQQDDCFNLVIDTIDFPWSGGYTPDIAKMVDTGDGFIIGGYTNLGILTSIHGDPVALNNPSGSYLAKYDYYGTLKWYTYSINRTTYSEDTIHYLDVDNQGNVIIAIRMTNEFIDATGKSYMNNSFSNQHRILKLDSNGRLLWTVEIDDFSGYTFTIDTNDNIIIAGALQNLNGNDDFFLNDVLQTSLTYPTVSYSFNHQLKSILKIDSLGNYVWHQLVKFDSNAFPHDIYKLETDSNDNIFFLFALRSGINVYNNNSVGSVFSITNNYISSGFIDRYGIIKLNASGPVIDHYSDYNHDISDFALDSQNNIVFHGDLDSDSGNLLLGKLDASMNLLWTQDTDKAIDTRAQKICIGSNDQIISTGYSWKLFGDTSNGVRFNGNGSNFVYVPTFEQSTYIAFYTSQGDIIKVLTDGNDDARKQSWQGIDEGIVGFFQDNNDNYFLAENINISEFNQTPYKRFGNLENPSFRSYDGMVSKFSESCATVYQSTLSSDDFKLSSFIIYPNPSNENFTIKSSFDLIGGQITIYDLTGKVLTNKTISNNLQSFFTPNKSGIYMIQVKLNSGTTLLEKLIVN